MTRDQLLVFERSKAGRRGYILPPLDVPEKPLEDLIPEAYLAKEKPRLPELTEGEIIRHYTKMSQLNYGVDIGFYPLGSCTMKYNPRLNEWAASLPGFTNLHPYQPEETVQGMLELLYQADKALAEVAGMAKMTLQPAAGAHGELTGVMIIRKYHKTRGEDQRHKIIVPDSAHGTNPATTAMAGYTVVEVKSNERGLVDIESLKEVLDDEVAGLMLTNPNTLGLFEEEIKTIADLVHGAGGLLYYDGANANAILGQARPGDMGFDIVHFNVHKTFSTPHGGGGPGAGPVGVADFLVDYLPKPTVEKKDKTYYLNYDIPHSIGRMKDFYGHIGIIIRTYTYILTMGYDGLKDVSAKAVLNANYLAQQLKGNYDLAIDGLCKHEFVLAGLRDKDTGVTTLDIAKRMMDFGYHPPTVYFPLIIDQALMVEPTETESLETLKEFVGAMNKIAQEAQECPEVLKEAPHTTPVRRPDETLAARKPVLGYVKKDQVEA